MYSQLNNEDDNRLPRPVWVPVSEDPILVVPPAPGGGSTSPAGSDLDLHIGWDRFEQLILAVAPSALGIVGLKVRRYGTRGQAQHGIDLAGREPDNRYTVIQCKDYQSLTVADLRTAVETFASGRRPFDAYRFVIATSVSGAKTQLNDEMATLQDTYPDLELVVWDSEEINDHLRYMGDVVARFWSRETSEVFCTGVRRQGVPAPPPDLQAQADRVLLGPLNTPDITPLLRDAERSSTEDPGRAADLYATLADRLFEAGFRGHATILRRRQLEALAEARQFSQAVGLAGQLAVAALDYGDRRTASELADLARTTHQRADTTTPDAPAREREVEVLGAAVEASMSPIGLPEHLWQSLMTPNAHVPAYQPALVLQLAETVFGLAPERLPELDPLIERAARQNDGLGTDFVTTVRLQLVRAEYDQAQRIGLARLARMHQLPGILVALVNAREARRYCLHGQVEEATEAWRTAVNEGIRAGYDGDAADWLYALRALNVQYGPWSENLDDEHRLAQALRASGSGRRLLDRVRAPREAAMSALVAHSPIEAIVWGRRWLVDAATAGSWADECDAVEFLGDLYCENREPALAAQFYQRAGAEKKATELARAVGDVLLPFGPLSNSPWWVLTTRAAQIATQSDLLRDDIAAQALDALMDLAVRGRAGELIDSPTGALAMRATQAACSLAERGTEYQAEALLALLVEDVPREPNHFKHTDEDHAEACVRIADSHPSLAMAALNRLLDLAEQNAQRAQKILVRSHVQVHFGGQPSGVASPPSRLSEDEQVALRERIADLAERERFLADVVLRAISPSHPLVRERASEARMRILTRAQPDPNRASFVTSLPTDAYLASALPSGEARECLDKVLSIAADGRETALGRQEALAAATGLVSNQEQPAKRATFLLAQEFVAGLQDGSHLDAEVTGEPHPLSALKINFGTSSLRGHGLKLAEAASVNEADEAWVCVQAVRMLRSADSDDVHAAATVLAGLSEAAASELDLNLLASHQAIGVRQACAVLCVGHPDRYGDLMLRLAADPEYRVRSVLASAVARASEAERPGLLEVQSVLVDDLRHSVRTALST